MMVTTIIISMSVTPRCLFIAPTDNVGIIPISAQLAIGAERQHIGLITVIAGILVEVWALPWVERDVLGQIRPGPLRRILRAHPQSHKALLRGREGPGIELV